MRLTPLLLLTLLPLALNAAPPAFQRPGAKPAFLAVDQAFELGLVEAQGGQIRVPFRVAPGHYLYQHRLRISPVNAAAGSWKARLQLPPGQPYHDEYFGDVVIYRDALNITLPAASPPAQLRIEYQGCADAGLCYPPQTRVVDVDVLP